mmetsp:Transcript_44118/g.139202  ORF Transcript_44118/g.139202 Transcript_44118/m.139202 type:complete len:299 (+) Transcript_44118:197-1093(+)
MEECVLYSLSFLQPPVKQLHQRPLAPVPEVPQGAHDGARSCHQEGAGKANDSLLLHRSPPRAARAHDNHTALDHFGGTDLFKGQDHAAPWQPRPPLDVGKEDGGGVRAEESSFARDQPHSHVSCSVAGEVKPGRVFHPPQHRLLARFLPQQQLRLHRHARQAPRYRLCLPLRSLQLLRSSPYHPGNRERISHHHGLQGSACPLRLPSRSDRHQEGKGGKEKRGGVKAGEQTVPWEEVEGGVRNDHYCHLLSEQVLDGLQAELEEKGDGVFRSSSCLQLNVADQIFHKRLQLLRWVGGG